MSRRRTSRYVPFQKPSIPEEKKKKEDKVEVKKEEKKKKVDKDPAKISPIEESLLKFAEKLMKKGPLNLQELYWLSINKLKLNAYEISQAIYQLIMKNYIAKKTIITDDNILESDKRKKIAIYISNFPGTSLKEIQNQLNITPQQAAYHLKMLEDFDYIKKSKINLKFWYFASKINPEFHESIIMLKNQDIFKVLELILLNPNSELITLSTKTPSLSAKVFNDILQKLKELDLITEMKGKKTKRYKGNIKKVGPLFEILKIPKSKLDQYKITIEKPS
ncbi:MAG: hypothetical protein HWN67_12345 [Candidatus Helarchaeota archaeon]|nr:hypothetical protein [Candidatus Helarchaeota archaeon]